MNLPEPFIQSLQNVQGFDEAAFRALHESGGQITSVRLNPIKFKIQNSKFNIESAVSWSSAGYYLTERPSFTTDPLFHAGAYYVQEASSMFLEEALQQMVDLSEPLKLLDLCAAPGGKSTLIQSLISTQSLLVSNEVIKARVTVLTENISKWGAANVIVTNNDPKDFARLPDFFDVIVVDAPCSGSGLFRKDPNAIKEWSEQNVELCNQRQQRILADVFASLKPGGVLIYSTCSYSELEDEQICDFVCNDLNAASLQIKVDEFPGIVETKSENKNAFGYRFYPDKIKGEGFFIAAFKKQQLEIEEERDNGKDRKKSKHSTPKLSAKEIEIVKPFVNNAAGYFYILQNDSVIAMPNHFENDLAIIQSSLYIKKAGVKMGTIIRNELIPDHELAISNLLPSNLVAVNVEKEDALQYLRKQEIKIDTNLKGWALICYQQLPLGWIKILPNRINNYYPKEWRILNK